MIANIANFDGTFQSAAELLVAASQARQQAKQFLPLSSKDLSLSDQEKSFSSTQVRPRQLTRHQGDTGRSRKSSTGSKGSKAKITYNVTSDQSRQAFKELWLEGGSSIR